LRRFPSHAELLAAFVAPQGAREPVRRECQEAWRAFCFNPDYPIYECWNRDYIDALARYLLERKRQYNNRTNAAGDVEPLRVLEAGAGTGKLTFGLRQAITRLVRTTCTISSRVYSRGTLTRTRAHSQQEEEKKEDGGGGDGIVIDAVDNSERPMKGLFPDVVREVDYREALHGADYTIVLCAWMPFGADWTSDFRSKVTACACACARVYERVCVCVC
jgi:SAM-dependent methyltransferase